MMILAPRRPDLTHAQFKRYVLEVHGPLVRSISEVAADIRHYHYHFPLQSVLDPVFGHPTASNLDIVTQAWFDSREAQINNMKHPRYLQILRPDEGRFADEAGAVMHYTEGHVVCDGRRAMTKVFYFRRRHPSLTREKFQKRWLRDFPQALELTGESHGDGVRYEQNHVMGEQDHPNGTDERYFDLIDEFFVNAPTDLERFSTPSIRANVAKVEEALLAAGRTRVFVAYTVFSIP